MEGLTIGCDPEFGLIDQNGRVVRASDLREEFPRTQVGVDGAGVVAEMRPAAKKCPIKLTAEIRKEFQQFYDGLPTGLKRYSWKAGSIAGDHPCGGHIHFGHERLLDARKDRFIKISTEILDKTLAIVSACLEEPGEFCERRLRTSYGRQGQTRPQPWGVEYRVLSSWLVAPAITEGILCLAYALMYDMDNPEFIDRAKTLRYLDMTKADQSELAEHAIEHYDLIMTLSLFKKYKYQINTLYKLVAQGKSWFPKKGMKEAWGVTSGSSDELEQYHKVVLVDRS